MIKLKREGQIGKFYNRYDFILPTNLCQLFWKTLGLSVGLTALGSVIGLYVLGAVMLFFPYYYHPTSFFFMIVTACAIALGGCYLIDKWREDRPYQPPAQWQQNLSAAYDGFKEKYCPLVGWTSED